MRQSQIWQDINAVVDDAIEQQWYKLDEAELVRRSDDLLRLLPTVGDEQIITAQLLLEHQAGLQRELCNGPQPRATFETLDEQLREFTRAVLVTFSTTEGISLENAALIALVLHKRGLAAFCAQPPVAHGL
jgi:predicted nucleic acid-binding protein